MRKHLVLVLCLASSAALAQIPNIEWKKAYGTIRGDNEGWMVQETSDGGFIIVGQNGGNEGYDRDIYLIKTDAVGDTVWTRSFETGSEEFGRAIRQTADGGFAVAGFIWNSNSANDAYLVKIDSLGNTQWQRIYQCSIYNDEARSLELTPDGGFIMVGRTGPPTDSDVLIVRVDSNGDTLWIRHYGGNFNDRAWSVKNTYDGGFIVVGWSNLLPAPAENSQIYIVKVNGDGDSLWTRRYGTAFNDEGRSVLELADRRIIVAGKFGTGSVTAHSILLCLDEGGDSLWSAAYESSYEATSVSSTLDGGFILCGYDIENSVYSEFVRKTDSLGQSLWTISGESNTYARYIVQTSDGGFAFAGDSSDSVSLSKISPDQTDINDEGLPLPMKLDFIKNYPNPFNSETKIEYILYDNSHVSLTLYDLVGREVANLIDSDQDIGIHQLEWHAQEMPSGVYFAMLQAGEYTATRKITLLK